MTFPRPALLCTGVTLLLLGLLAWRMDAEPLQVYGDGSAQYIEHAARLEIQTALAANEGDWRSALRLADDTVLTHPPGLHLITLLGTRLSGASAEASLWTAPLWLLLLALALGWTSKQLTGTPRAAYAAFLGTLLLPAAHGAATRVHYDLPMTVLLWAAVATLLWGVRSRPSLGGLLTAAGAGEDRVARARLGAGGSLMAVRVYDSLVGLEFLRALSRVDSERIAPVGHSGGSLQNLLTVRLTQGFAAHINDGRAEYSSWDEGLIADKTLPGLYPHSDSLSRLQAIPTPSLRLGYGYPRGPGPILDFLGKTLGYVSPPSGGSPSSRPPPNSP